MNTKYKVISTFRSCGSLTESRNWADESRIKWLDRGALSRLIDDRSSSALPVNGAPMQAKDTLLAALISNSKTAAAILGGSQHSESEAIGGARQYLDWLREGTYGTRAAIQCVRSYMAPATRGQRGLERLSPTSVGALVGKLISVEIECYSREWPKETPTTNVVYDGSLSDRHLGREGREIRRVTWVSNGRLNGLLGLAEHLNDARVDKRCGLHVHVDARHLPKGNIDDDGPLHTASETHRRLVEMQKHLKKLIPRSRWNNRYCKFKYNGPLTPPEGVRQSGERYCAINWSSYREHGSIEFRCGAGSVNVVKIESWALLCSHLLNYAARKENAIPRTWQQFLAILPGWLQQWCILRHCKLHGGLLSITSRVASAADLNIPADTTSVE